MQPSLTMDTYGGPNTIPAPTGNQPPQPTSPLSLASTGVLPGVTQSPTAPATVISSQTAKDALKTQREGLNQANQFITNKPIANPTVSIVDALNAKGQASDFTSRTQLAKKYGIENYTGTAAQNQQLIQLISNPPQQTSTTSTNELGQTTSSTTTTGSQQPNTPQGPQNSTYVAPGVYSLNLGNGVDGKPVLKFVDEKGEWLPNYGSSSQSINPNQPVEKSELNTRLDELDKAYTNYDERINQILNGTFPLTPDQQAQLNETKAAFERTRQLQINANQNYENLARQAAYRKGGNITDPNQFLAQRQQDINLGIDRISAIDAAASRAFNELKTSFMDKNYKMITESYDKLNNYLKERNTLIQKAKDDATALEKDLRDYNFKVDQENYKRQQDEITNDREAQKLADQLLTSASNRETDKLQREKLVYDIKKVKSELSNVNPTVLGASASNVAFYDALTNASIGLPENQRKEITKQMNTLLARGDVKGAQEILIRTAFQGQTGSQKEDTIRRMQAIDALSTVKEELDKFVAVSGDTGILQGNMQKIQQKLGQSGNPEAAKISARITQALQIYRNAITGAAWGTQETGEYETIFPSLTDTNKLNSAKIDAMVEAMNANQRVMLGSYIGQSTYDTVFADKVASKEVKRNPINTAISDAKASGYEPEEIIQAIDRNFPQYSVQMNEALLNGYTPEEVIEYIGTLEI